MFSGKGAAYDLVSEFEGFSCDGYRNEFDLLRIPGGVLDLSDALHNWTYIGVDAAIRRFIEISDEVIRQPKGLQRFYLNGWNYEARYPGIREATDVFLNQLIEVEWQSSWPYAEFGMSGFESFVKKMKSRLLRDARWREVSFRLAASENFNSAANQYLDDIFSLPLPHDAARHTIVMNNALDPSNPAKGLRVFDRMKSIVVDRDVRDIYLTSISYSHGFNDNVALYSKIAGASDVDTFIKRQRLLRQENRDLDSMNQRLLRLRFEDLITDYDGVVAKLYQFLDVSSDQHNKYSAFKPDESAKNMGLWKSVSGQVLLDIKRIEQALPDYCYD